LGRIDEKTPEEERTSGCKSDFFHTLLLEIEWMNRRMKIPLLLLKIRCFYEFLCTGREIPLAEETGNIG